jgi:vesicle transport protein SEC22
MIRHTLISRLDGKCYAHELRSSSTSDKETGLILTASVDDGEVDDDFIEVKGKIKLVLRRLDRNSEPKASIESGKYTYQYDFRSLCTRGSAYADVSLSYIIDKDLCFICICDKSYPRKLAFTYLSDLSSEFKQTYNDTQYLSPECRPYAFAQFDTFIQRTKQTYQDSRATQNLDKLNDELKDVTRVMTKNIEDLLYRGDSLERMGDISSRLREDSRKYKKAAVRINWELLLKQVSRGRIMECCYELKLTRRLVWTFWRVGPVHHYLRLVAFLLGRLDIYWSGAQRRRGSCFRLALGGGRSQRMQIYPDHDIIGYLSAHEHLEG